MVIVTCEWITNWSSLSGAVGCSARHSTYTASAEPSAALLAICTLVLNAAFSAPPCRVDIAAAPAHEPAVDCTNRTSSPSRSKCEPRSSISYITS